MVNTDPDRKSGNTLSDPEQHPTRHQTDIGRGTSRSEGGKTGTFATTNQGKSGGPRSSTTACEGKNPHICYQPPALIRKRGEPSAGDHIVHLPEDLLTRTLERIKASMFSALKTSTEKQQGDGSK